MITSVMNSYFSTDGAKALLGVVAGGGLAGRITFFDPLKGMFVGAVADAMTTFITNRGNVRAGMATAIPLGIGGGFWLGTTLGALFIEKKENQHPSAFVGLLGAVAGGFTLAKIVQYYCDASPDVYYMAEMCTLLFTLLLGVDLARKQIF